MASKQMPIPIIIHVSMVFFIRLFIIFFVVIVVHSICYDYIGNKLPYLINPY